MPLYPPPSNTLFKCTIPFVFPTSGSFANNGALSGITAVPNTYPNAYVYLKANVVVAAGQAAGWYYAVFSSTTAATVYNNVYDPTVGGVPTIPTSPTAFATTGPGAFAQDVSAGRAGPTFNLPAGALGINDTLKCDFAIRCANSANAKSIGIRAGASNVISVSMASLGGANFEATIQMSQDSLSKQLAYLHQSGGGATQTSTPWNYNGSFNFANAQAIDHFPTISNVADWMVLTHVRWWIER